MWLNVDKNQILQVLFNLMANAVEAMPNGGELTVRTYKTYPSLQSVFSSDRPVCVIEISDRGEGIPKENLQRLFEPFFTTKRERKGTGLGLSIAKTIVENHQGDLLIESEPGQGTQVWVLLPLNQEGKNHEKNSDH